MTPRSGHIYKQNDLPSPRKLEGVRTAQSGLMKMADRDVSMDTWHISLNISLKNGPQRKWT
jgi:hypothetical protein